MSQHEQFAWGSLLASVATWLFLTMRMTESWMIVNAPPRHMIWTYVAVVILMIVAHAVLAGVLGAVTALPFTTDALGDVTIVGPGAGRSRQRDFRGARRGHPDLANAGRTSRHRRHQHRRRQRVASAGRVAAGALHGREVVAGPAARTG